MLCPYCQQEIPADTLFCPNCGQRIAQQSGQSEMYTSYWESVEKEAIRDNEIKLNAEKKVIAERRKKKFKFIVSLLFSLIIIGIVAFFIYYINILPKQRYQAATELIEKEQFAEALEILNDLGSYKDSLSMEELCNNSIMQEQYQNAIALYEEGKFEEALSLFEDIADYSESNTYIINCQNQIVNNIPLVCEWDFNDNLNEINGRESVAFGDVAIVDLNGVPAAHFDGDGDYISCGNGLNMSDEFTFNTVIQCQDVYKNYSAFFAKYEINGAGAYAFSINQGYVNCWITDSEGSHIEIESETEIEENQWYCISIIRNGSTISLYINGSLEKQGSIDSVMQNDDTVTIGRQALMFSPEDQLQFTGYIKSLSIFDCALDDEQITMLSNVSLNN